MGDCHTECKYFLLMAVLYLWKATLFLVLTMPMLWCTTGNTITAFLGDSKVFQWTLKNSYSSTTPVRVFRHNDLGFVSLFTVFGTNVTIHSGTFRGRVSNTDNTNTNTRHIEFTLNDIKAEDGGDYKTAINYEDPYITKGGLRLLVYVRPRKPEINVVSYPVDGKDMTLSCETRSYSKPNDHGVQMKYKWYRYDSELFTGGRYIVFRSQLQMKNIQRTDTSTVITCGVFETEALPSDISDDYVVDVEYGPGLITISPSSGPYVLKENDRLNEITCSSSCNPKCWYTWIQPSGAYYHSRTFLSISKIRRDEAGQYVCKVSNSHWGKESRITVVVQYSPEKPVLRINGNYTDVRESSPITLICTTQSVPPANLTIYGSNMTGVNVKGNTLISSFTIPHVNCLDTGIFYCSAENDFGNSNSSGVNVNVLCKPRPDNRVSQTLKQGLNSGDSMDISGTLISNPEPAIHWSMRHIGSSVSRNLTNNTDNFMFYNNMEVPTITSQAKKSNMKQNEFGEYSMHAENEYGKSVMVFTVTQKRSPDGPELTALTCNLSKAVEITFKPNFNGGDTQRFSIGMKSESDAAFKKVGDELPDNNEQEMTLKGPILDQRVSYAFRVTATNSYGTTSSINEVKCSIVTEHAEKSSSDSVFPYGIAMLVTGLVALTATIILGIWLYVGRKRTRQNSAQCFQDIGQTISSVENEQYIGMEGNRNVVSEELEQQSTTNSTTEDM